MIKIDIVEDIGILARLLAENINVTSDTVRVQNLYGDLKSFREGLQKFQPDVVLLDIGLPDGNGMDFCTELKAKYPEVKVIMFTLHDNRFSINQSIAKGVVGFITKETSTDEIIEGVEAVYAGEKYFSNSVDRILRKYGYDKIYNITEREKETLKYLADGFTEKEIAVKMGIKPVTVTGFKDNVKEKLGSKNATQSVSIAKNLGII
ncbi:MAG: response regulator transcription factor [Tannerella sp.]|jgi:DNA-binding NarL/FixJ family response regulator|nr:response regulator transcription factor [Tannerella sp.]